MSEADRIIKFLGAASADIDIRTLQRKMRAGEDLSFTIVDQYDFNDKEKLAGGLNGFLEDIKASWSLLTNQRSMYQAVRKLASWRQVNGYEGFPVALEVSITGDDYLV